MNDSVKKILIEITGIETDEDVFTVGNLIEKSYIDCEITSSDKEILYIYLNIATHNLMKAPTTTAINPSIDGKMPLDYANEIMRDIQKNDMNI